MRPCAGVAGLGYVRQLLEQRRSPSIRRILSRARQASSHKLATLTASRARHAPPAGKGNCSASTFRRRSSRARLSPGERPALPHLELGCGLLVEIKGVRGQVGEAEIHHGIRQRTGGDGLGRHGLLAKLAAAQPGIVLLGRGDRVGQCQCGTGAGDVEQG